MNETSKKQRRKAKNAKLSDENIRLKYVNSEQRQALDKIREHVDQYLTAQETQEQTIGSISTTIHKLDRNSVVREVSAVVESVDNEFDATQALTPASIQDALQPAGTVAFVDPPMPTPNVPDKSVTPMFAPGVAQDEEHDQTALLSPADVADIIAEPENDRMDGVDAKSDSAGQS